MAITETDLTKLLSTAESAAKRAETDTADVAEEGRAVDALRVLGQQTVTADLLAKTAAGKRVKKLEKHPSKKVASEAAATVAAWKECVRKEQASKPREGSQPESEAPSAGEDGSQPANGSTLAKAPSNRLVLDRDPEKTGDETRDRIRKLIKEALAPAVTPDNFGDPCAVAVDVENAMYNQFSGVNDKYKAKFRSLSFNLKDPKNPDLRNRVLAGQIPGDVLVNLSAEELASNEMRAKNEQIREHLKNEAVRGQSNQASTDMFQCGKCRQRKCTYYQMQTRSADEASPAASLPVNKTLSPSSALASDFVHMLPRLLMCAANDNIRHMYQLWEQMEVLLELDQFGTRFC